MVDAGGGNGILNQMEKANLKFADFHDIFVTHAHTDHLLGVVWVIRMALEEKQRLRVWSHRKVLNLLTHICLQILPSKKAEKIGNLVTMHEIEDGDRFEVGDLRLQCFDIHSKKERQFGFTALLPNGQRFCCLGDEPYNPLCEHYAEGWYDYNHGLGVVTKDESSCVAAILEIIENHFAMPKQYADYAESMFPYRDNHNCERVYNAICSIEKKKNELC